MSKRWFGRKHDTILFYSKSGRYTFHPQKEKSYLTHKYGFANVEIEQDAQGYFRRAAMRDVWDIPALRGNQPEATGYPTQKPLALYERLGRQWIAMDVWDEACEMLERRLELEGLKPKIVCRHRFSAWLRDT